MRNSRVAWIAVVVLSLVLSSCSSHEDAAVTTSTSAADGDAGDATEAAAGVFGTLEDPVCGPGEGSGSGAGEQGVSADAIQETLFSQLDELKMGPARRAGPTARCRASRPTPSASG